MTVPNPCERAPSASSVSGVQDPQHDENKVSPLPREDHDRCLVRLSPTAIYNGDIVTYDPRQRPTNDDPVTHGVHGPHAERFEPKEEGWLSGGGPSVSHVEHGSSLANEVPADANRLKCFYCVASETHTPHLHNVQLCTCGFRNANGIDPSSRDSATGSNATSSGPRFDPQQLLRRSTPSANLIPVNGPDISVANGAASRARRNGMDLPPLSRSSTAGTRAATYRPSPVPSLYTSGPPQEADSTNSRMAQDDDPKGKRPVAASADVQESLMPNRGVQPSTFGSHESLSARPPRSDLAAAASDSGSESDDEVTIAGDADDDQSSNAAAPSASVGTLHRVRKRRRRNPTVNDTRPRSAVTDQIPQRRRHEQDTRRAGTVTHALSRRSLGARIPTSVLPSEMTGNSFRPDEGLSYLHERAMEVVDGSHRRVMGFLGSFLVSDQKLRAELAEAKRDNEKLRKQLAESERNAFRLWETYMAA